MELLAIWRTLELIAKFLGLESIGSMWYLGIAIAAFAWLYNRQKNIRKDHYDLMSNQGELLGEIKALHMRQDMQRDFVGNQESRYIDLLNKYTDCNSNYHALSNKMIKHEIEHKKSS